MAPFYGWGSAASRLEPLQGGSLLFTHKFLPKKETVKKQFSQDLACNFTKNELLPRYFSRILTANFKYLFSRTLFKWLLLQRRIQDLVQMKLFCEYNERLKTVNYFHKKAPS